MTGMPVVSSQYRNMVYGGSAEEVLQDKEGLQTTLQELKENILTIPLKLSMITNRSLWAKKKGLIFHA